ncbi:MAG: TlpA disulfide reductase family protein [Flavobacteriales bacterium]|nr:TlpA disulfide reductase family protein [Flavobacteriales bacterium]
MFANRISNTLTTKTLFFALLSILLVFFTACEQENIKPKAGDWTLLFWVDELKIPIRLEIDSLGKFAIYNAGEVIKLDSVVYFKDSFRLEMPLFQSHLTGKVWSTDSISGEWKDRSRDGDYSVAFTAVPGNIKYISNSEPVWETYDVTFSPDSAENVYKAVLKLATSDNRKNVRGTFLTETGDYRYLSGERHGDEFYLSCFDGSHLFYFDGEMKGDSVLGGYFASGKHWNEPWEARRDENAGLHDPDSLTFLVNSDQPFSFRAKNIQGDQVTFENGFFKDKVTLVQIFGSWCPNCTDESRWLKQVYERYNGAGFQVVPVAFERGTDMQEMRAGVQKQWRELEMPYPPFIGGKSHKGEAGKVFSMLSKVMSYPTAIIIDRSGNVRKIHTGFYGPGTGKFYTHHTEKLEMFIKQLLEE